VPGRFGEFKIKDEKRFKRVISKTIVAGVSLYAAKSEKRAHGGTADRTIHRLNCPLAKVSKARGSVIGE